MVILGLSFAASRVCGGMLRRAMAGETLTVDPGARRFVVEMVQVAVLLFGLVIYAHVAPPLHKLANALLASASILSLVVGIAAQPTLGNLIAGLALLVYRPFSVGDRISIIPIGFRDPQIVIVDSFSLGHTRLRAQDGTTVVMPNTLMFNTVVTLLGAEDQAPAAPVRARSPARRRKSRKPA